MMQVDDEGEDDDEEGDVDSSTSDSVESEESDSDESEDEEDEKEDYSEAEESDEEDEEDVKLSQEQQDASPTNFLSSVPVNLRSNSRLSQGWRHKQRLEVSRKHPMTMCLEMVNRYDVA